ncbi:MAG: DHH family phosphoesterase, partial [Methanococcaceae archaeon]
MIEFEKLKEVLLSSSKVLITTHVNPDADAIGSEMAIYHLLTELGKDVYIINFSSTPYNLDFLDPSGVIKQYSSGLHDELIRSADLFIAVDFNRSDRVVKMKDAVDNSNAVKICIDHHLQPENFVDYQFIDDNYSSTGEIIYDFIKKTG